MLHRALTKWELVRCAQSFMSRQKVNELLEDPTVAFFTLRFMALTPRRGQQLQSLRSRACLRLRVQRAVGRAVNIPHSLHS